MKRITIWATVAAVLVLMAVVIVRADARGRHGWCGRGWHRAGPASYLAHELNLSDAQRTQIRTLWRAERPIVSADLHQFLAENKEMNAVAAQGNPDPGKVQEIANREGATIAALLVEKERMQSKVYATVLNPEQRAKADELQKKLESRLDRGADRLGTQTAGK
jgi:Spy/CpxP family protein refolding chaperone